MTPLSTIKSNYQKCLDNVSKTLQKANRIPDSVKLVVVTKGQSCEKIQEVIDAGAKILGENYPEETAKKIEFIKTDDIQWQMIGHIQSRKIKYLVDLFSSIHSIDSLEMAVKIDGKLYEKKRTLPVLYEINISGEESKYGIPAAEENSWPLIRELFTNLICLQNARCSGLMTMPPISNDPEDSRKYFKKLRKLSMYLGKELGDQYFGDLSMGTSFDYEVAIEEGATYIRVGEAIMGPRNYKLKAGL